MQIPQYYNSNLKAFEKQETLTIETTLMVNYNSPMVKINTKFVAQFRGAKNTIRTMRKIVEIKLNLKI